jgi:hypothetical protein
VVLPDVLPPELKEVRLAIDDYWSQRKAKVTPDDIVPHNSLRVIVRRRMGPSKWGAFATLFEQFLLLPIDLDPATERAAGHIFSRDLLGHLANGILRDNSNGGGTNIPEIIQYLRKVSSSFNGDRKELTYLEADQDYWSSVYDGRVSSGFPGLDLALGGGLGGGELGVVIGPPGGGKTTLLINIGAVSVLAGLKVLHLSMELNKVQVLMRYDMRFSGETKESLQANPKYIKAARKASVVNGGGLTILDMSHSVVTPSLLESILESQDKVDMVLVDYADLMRSDRYLHGTGGSDIGRRFELGEIYRDLRRLAAALEIPVWTASQANREASKKGIYTSLDIGEDISKMHTADVGICMLQTDQMEAENRMVLLLDKTRMGKSNLNIPVRVNFETATFWEESNA